VNHDARSRRQRRLRQIDGLLRFLRAEHPALYAFVVAAFALAVATLAIVLAHLLFKP